MTALTNLTLKIWRQDGPDEQGRFESHQIPEISDEASFLELLDILNERLIEEGKDAIVFDHDCREGICGTCSLMIDGQAHGPQRGTATCQLHMRCSKRRRDRRRAVAAAIIRTVGRAVGPHVGGCITDRGRSDGNLIRPKPVADASMDAQDRRRVANWTSPVDLNCSGADDRDGRCRVRRGAMPASSRSVIRSASVDPNTAVKLVQPSTVAA